MAGEVMHGSLRSPIMVDGSFGGLYWLPSQEINHNRKASASTKTIQRFLLKVVANLLFSLSLSLRNRTKSSCLYTLHLPPSSGDRRSCHVAFALHICIAASSWTNHVCQANRSMFAQPEGPSKTPRDTKQICTIKPLDSKVGARY